VNQQKFNLIYITLWCNLSHLCTFVIKTDIYDYETKDNKVVRMKETYVNVQNASGTFTKDLNQSA